jgi:hypothetical protein
VCGLEAAQLPNRGLKHRSAPTLHSAEKFTERNFSRVASFCSAGAWNRFGSHLPSYRPSGQETRAGFPSLVARVSKWSTKAVSRRPHSKGSADLIYAHASAKVTKWASRLRALRCGQPARTICYFPPRRAQFSLATPPGKPPNPRTP